MESLYEIWGRRSPQFETRYQDSVINVFSDYGKTVNQYQEVRGKTFGPGYEVFIIAFFIGLYYNRTKQLTTDKNKRKPFGHPISNWIGSREIRNNRKPYEKLRHYIFAALIARTDIDLIALDKGELKASKVVDKLIQKMEEYANFGLDYIEEKLENDPNCFFSENAFLNVFTSRIEDDVHQETDEEDIPESLD